MKGEKFDYTEIDPYKVLTRIFKIKKINSELLILIRLNRNFTNFYLDNKYSQCQQISETITQALVCDDTDNYKENLIKFQSEIIKIITDTLQNEIETKLTN